MAGRTQPFHFTKLHGLGNDFLVVDVRTLDPATAAAVQDPDNVRRLCDRQFGVGGDGVLAVGRPSTTGAVASMRVLNADGSEAEMCGNGLRCVAKHLWEASASASATLPNTRMVIDTGAGPLACVVAVDRGAVTSVEIDMGRPRLTRTEIPMTGPDDERCVDQPITIPGDTGGERRVTCVSMGNPHAVVFVDDAAAPMALATTIGPALERHAWFPKKTNAEFAHVASRTEIDLVVWERGAGLTLACGTGACATAVAACLTGRADPGTAITVRLPGGPLTITVAQDYSTVTMRGPARRVFEADLDLAKLPDAARPT
jgi:diaminopimelate epimerase